MRMKKFMNFIGEGVGEKFLHDIRRVATTADFWRACENSLNHDAPMALEPSESAVEQNQAAAGRSFSVPITSST